MNKKAMLAAGTFKLLFATLCIIVLGVLLFKLSKNLYDQNEIESAKATLDSIVLKSNAISSENPVSTYLAIGPKDWYILSFFGGDEKPPKCQSRNCLCVCGEPNKESCSEKGVCEIVDFDITENCGSVERCVFLSEPVDLTISKDLVFIISKAISNPVFGEQKITEILNQEIEIEMFDSEWNVLEENQRITRKEAIFLALNAPEIEVGLGDNLREYLLGKSMQGVLEFTEAQGYQISIFYSVGEGEFISFFNPPVFLAGEVDDRNWQIMTLTSENKGYEIEEVNIKFAFREIRND